MFYNDTLTNSMLFFNGRVWGGLVDGEFNALEVEYFQATDLRRATSARRAN